MEQRLQKILSSAGVTSRRNAEKLLLAGRVSVNGIVATLGQSADPDSDRITVDGFEIACNSQKTYLVLNKPKGYVTTLHDDKNRPTVAELVFDVGKRVYPVGRLDMDSDGLLLFTDDGELANALMHPSHNVPKTYRTVVSGNISEALPVLESSMIIDGYQIQPGIVKVLSENVLLITIHEGRNRQVRKMCAAAGLVVQRLTRIEEGPIQLGGLKVGKWRMLTENEVSELKKCILN